ncbi:hypothetical protein V5O48_011860 [Marasmius crinis-equi]|uniref:Uncharacterized protein n=1 Tax=Marasmius crinis-equi TaxID=585013 RepID=A0ABR3F4S3_9AGAR
MVLTRGQAARTRLAQQHTDQFVTSTATPTPRSSPRKRTSVSVPKLKAKATAKKIPTTSKGKDKAKANAPKSETSTPYVSTPEHPFGRAWPPTPRAPRKSDGPSLKPDFPSHLASSPHPSINGTALVLSDADDFDDAGTPTPAAPSAHHPCLPTPVPPPDDDDTSTVVLSDSDDDHRTPPFLSPRDIAAGIPGKWERKRGESSRRLVVVPEDADVQRDASFHAVF